MSRLYSMRGWPHRAKYWVPLTVASVVIGIVVLRSFARMSDIAQTQSAVFEIQSAAIRWQIDHGDSACPNIKRLIEGKYLMSHTRRVDAWNQAFAITCFELTIGVTSFGPDGTRGTKDDLVAPPIPVRQ